MQSKRFDDLTRVLATGLPRRSLLRGLAAGTAVAIVAATRVGGAEARVCRKFGERCNQSENCCHGKCAPRRKVCDCHHSYQAMCINPQTQAERCCPKNKPNCCR